MGNRTTQALQVPLKPTEIPGVQSLPSSLEHYKLSRLPCRPLEKYPVPPGIPIPFDGVEHVIQEHSILFTELWNRLWRHFFQDGTPGETET